jgi:hypothetical protein
MRVVTWRAPSISPFWKGTPVAVKRWFDPDMSDQVIQEFREVGTDG